MYTAVAETLHDIVDLTPRDKKLYEAHRLVSHNWMTLDSDYGIGSAEMSIVSHYVGLYSRVICGEYHIIALTNDILYSFDTCPSQTFRSLLMILKLILGIRAPLISTVNGLVFVDLLKERLELSRTTRFNRKLDVNLFVYLLVRRNTVNGLIEREVFDKWVNDAMIAFGIERKLFPLLCEHIPMFAPKVLRSLMRDAVNASRVLNWRQLRKRKRDSCEKKKQGTCTVCFDDTEVVVLDCKHELCDYCLTRCRSLSSMCPVCREHTVV